MDIKKIKQTINNQENDNKDIRCKACNRLLLKIVIIKKDFIFDVKCPRCKKISRFTCKF